MIFILHQCFAGNPCNDEYNDKKEETLDDYSISLYNGIGHLQHLAIILSRYIELMMICTKTLSDLIASFNPFFWFNWNLMLMKMHICFISIKWHVSPHSVSRECMIPISIWINHHNAGSLLGVKVCDLYDKQKPWPFILWRKNRYQHVLGNTLFWIINLWMLW